MASRGSHPGPGLSIWFHKTLLPLFSAIGRRLYSPGGRPAGYSSAETLLYLIISRRIIDRDLFTSLKAIPHSTDNASPEDVHVLVTQLDEFWLTSSTRLS
ncbi:hypothetical protein VTN02DRAFT_3599 [Thermoascus thermophilus]